VILRETQAAVKCTVVGSNKLQTTAVTTQRWMLHYRMTDSTVCRLQLTASTHACYTITAHSHFKVQSYHKRNGYHCKRQKSTNCIRGVSKYAAVAQFQRQRN